MSANGNYFVPATQKLDRAARCSQTHSRNLTRQEERRKQAEDRNEKYRELTTEEKIKHLDDTLGVGQGAVKQRKKLKQQLAKDRAQTKKQ